MNTRNWLIPSQKKFTKSIDKEIKIEQVQNYVTKEIIVLSKIETFSDQQKLLSALFEIG